MVLWPWPAFQGHGYMSIRYWSISWRWMNEKYQKDILCAAVLKCMKEKKRKKRKEKKKEKYLIVVSFIN